MKEEYNNYLRSVLRDSGYSFKMIQAIRNLNTDKQFIKCQELLDNYFKNTIFETPQAFNVFTSFINELEEISKEGNN